MSGDVLTAAQYDDKDIVTAISKWPDQVHVCLNCEKTILAEESTGKIYCTCDPVGVPLVGVADRPELQQYLVGKSLSNAGPIGKHGAYDY